MQEHKTIQSFLNVVAEQIRWKCARPVVTAELERHLEDQRDAFAAEGLENAEELAVEEMGDPVIVGTELDRVHRPKPQWGIIALTVIFALVGVLLRIFLTAGWKEIHMAENPVKVLVAFGLGCAALLGGYFLDYSRFGHYAGKVYIGTLVVGAFLLRYSTFINRVPDDVWFMTFYARFFALIFPVVYALWLYSCRNKGWRGLTMMILGGVPLALYCYCVPYTLGLIVHLLSGFVLVLVAAWNDWFGVGRWKSMIPPLACAGTMTGIFTYGIIRLDWSSYRFNVLLHPERQQLRF